MASSGTALPAGEVALGSTTVSDEEPLTGGGSVGERRLLCSSSLLALTIAAVAVSAAVFGAVKLYPPAEQSATRAATSAAMGKTALASAGDHDRDIDVWSDEASDTDEARSREASDKDEETPGNGEPAPDEADGPTGSTFGQGEAAFSEAFAKGKAALDEAAPVVTPAPWECHDYVDGQDNRWCETVGELKGFEYRFEEEGSRCGACWCCKRSVGIAAIRSMIAVTRKRMEEGDTSTGREEEEAPPTYTTAFMFGLQLTQAVSQGWGHRLWLMGVMHERFVNWCEESVMIMPQDNVDNFNHWGLSPPDVVAVPDAKFWDSYEKHFSSLPVDQTFRAMVLGDWRGEDLNGNWMAYQSTQTHMYQALLGCWPKFDDFLWRMFKPLLASYKKPISGKYIGMHIRHGDKVTEGRLIQIDELIQSVRAQHAWDGIKDFFVATDDDNVLKNEINREHEPKDCVPLHSDGCYSIPDAKTCASRRDGRADMPTSDGFKVYGEPCVWCDRPGDCGTGNKCEPLGYLQGKGLLEATDWIARCPLNMTKAWIREYNFKWTDYRRWPGGEPDTSHGDGLYNHNHDAASMRAVIDDTLSLAFADVMIGSFNSNFFKLPWLLNYYRRTPEQRKGQWCWDAFTNTPCNDRPEIVKAFLHEAWRNQVPYMPSDTPTLWSCENPQLVSGTVTG